MTTNLLQHPCWGKRYLYTAEQLATMDTEFTEAVAKENAERIKRDDANLLKLKEMFADETFHHATYRHEGKLWDGWFIYRKDANGFRGYSLALSFSAKSHVKDAVTELVRNTGWSLGSYGNG